MLDESHFPPEDALTDAKYMQAHKDWLALMKTSAESSIYDGWKAHHDRMCDDPDLLKWAQAWCSHGKQLHTSFMDCPFIINPDSSTYHHQFKCEHLDLWTSMPTWCSPWPQAVHSASNCFAPYDKADKPLTQNPLRSFCDPKNTRCLRCGMRGHRANSFQSPSN